MQMQSNDKKPNTAKVFVFKQDEPEHPLYPWAVGVESIDGMILIRHEDQSFQDAWAWLDANYVRETP